jgi:hypothetical protein
MDKYEEKILDLEIATLKHFKHSADTQLTFGFWADSQNPSCTVQVKKGSNTKRITSNEDALLGGVHYTEYKHTIQIASTMFYATRGIQV